MIEMGILLPGNFKNYKRSRKQGFQKQSNSYQQQRWQRRRSGDKQRSQHQRNRQPQRWQRPNNRKQGWQGPGQYQVQQQKGMRQRQVLRRFDRNSDGKISKQEFPGNSRFFDRIDSDKNGCLTIQEIYKLRSMLSQQGGTRPRQQRGKQQGGIRQEGSQQQGWQRPENNQQKVRSQGNWNQKRGNIQNQAIQKFDKDRDGRISKNEFPNPVVFNIIDTNKDGYFTIKEMRKIINKFSKQKGINQQKNKWQQQFNTQQNGKNKKLNFRKLDKNRNGKISKDEFSNPTLFDIIDKNENGYLTRSEFRAFYKSSKKKYKRK